MENVLRLPAAMKAKQWMDDHCSNEGQAERIGQPGDE
jgi:hypothetical protein